MKKDAENLLINGRFEHQSITPWKTDIEDLKFESVKKPEGAYSLYMPVETYIEQKVSGSFTEDFLLQWGCNARIDAPAHMGSVIVFMVFVFFEGSNDPIIASSGFGLSSEWTSFNYEHLRTYTPDVREIYLQVHNANWANLEGAFNAPVQVTDLYMSVV